MFMLLSVSQSICLSRVFTRLWCAKTAEWIEVLFREKTFGAQETLLDGGPDSQRRGEKETWGSSEAHSPFAKLLWTRNVLRNEEGLYYGIVSVCPSMTLVRHSRLNCSRYLNIFCAHDTVPRCLHHVSFFKPDFAIPNLWGHPKQMRWRKVPRVVSK